MSANNGIIRIGRKGLKKFAFGEDSLPFEVDVVVAFQQWISIDDNFRPEEENEEGNRPIPTAEMPAYHEAARAFVTSLIGIDQSGQINRITIAEALDFIARLREQYDELAVFFRPKSRKERDSPSISEPQSEVRFSVEESEPK